MRSNSQHLETEIISRLTELRDLAGPHFVHELIVLFFKMGRKDLDAMKTASVQSSQEKFKLGAQSLKASSFNLGATALASVCEQAEALASLNSKPETQELLQRLESQLSGIENFLREYIQESHSSAS